MADMGLRRIAVVMTAGVVATTMLGALAIVGMGAPAGAAESGSCARVSGNVRTTVTLSKCTPEPGTRAKLEIPSSLMVYLGTESSLTWRWAHHGTGSMITEVAGLSDPGPDTGCKDGSNEAIYYIGLISADTTGAISNGSGMVLTLCEGSGGVKPFPGTPPLQWSP
jgi:hypothetical protein